MDWNICVSSDSLFVALRLARQAFLKKTEIKLELLNDNDMLLIVEKGISVGICHAIYQCARPNNK